MIQALPMQIEVRLFAFETDIPQPIRIVFDHSPSLADVLSNLPIPDGMETVVLVNGRNATPQTVLSEGDRIAVFPPMTGG
jgi:molybdopterin converting factor small subunit